MFFFIVLVIFVLYSKSDDCNTFKLTLYETYSTSKTVGGNKICYITSNSLLEDLLDKEPWFMRNMASKFISEKQAAQIDDQAEAYQRATLELNNKTVQTENVSSPSLFRR